MASGVFITFEGIEGAGKSSHAARLADHLRAQGRRVLVTREPGGTRVGELVRGIFLDPAVSLEATAELLLALADRAQHVAETLKPALAEGQVVICDRFSDSTTAYQGHGRGFDLELIAQLNELASGGLVPDLTILLDCPVESGLARTRARGGGAPDRFEAADGGFHLRVREGFKRIARANPRRVILIDSSQVPDLVGAEIRAAVQTVIERLCR